jgi:hypothetical protein
MNTESSFLKLNENPLRRVYRADSQLNININICISRERERERERSEAHTHMLAYMTVNQFSLSFKLVR